MPKYKNSAFRLFWKSRNHEGKVSFCKRAKANFSYMAQVACGSRRPSGYLTRMMVRHGEGEFQLHDLRPDLWPKPRAPKPAPAETAPPVMAAASDFTTPPDFC